MTEWALAKTASRSVLGTMSEFAHMADYYRWNNDEVIDLVELALWLADTPCRVSSPAHALWPIDALRARLA